MFKKKRQRTDRNNGGEFDSLVTSINVDFGSPSMDRLFSHRIRVVKEGSAQFLEAMVLPNHICVLRCVFPMDVVAVSYPEHISCNELSGKQKKNAYVIGQGNPAIILRMRDESEITLYSPVRGKVLEMNMNIIKDPSLLMCQHLTLGYTLILQPDTKIFDI
jgi:hypothetical protein